MTLSLDERLAAAAAYVRRGRVAADIGCDHGKLAIWLVQSGTCPRVLACDLREKPLAAARRNAAAYGVAEQVELRLGDGLAPLQKGEATEYILAGVSGTTAAHILQDAPWAWQRDSRFIFVPACRPQALRQWLLENGFAILDETPVQAQGRHYTVLYAAYTGEKQPYTLADVYIGRLAGKPHAKRLLQSARNFLRDAIGGEKNEEQRAALETALAQVEEAMAQCPQP